MNIREIRISDAESMRGLNLRLDNESAFMLFEPGERKLSVEGQASHIERALENDRVIWLVAEAEDGSLQGFCVVSGNPVNRVRHVGSVVIGVTKSYWGQGIGFGLLSQAIERSLKSGFERLELTVRPDNKRAILLYKKLGFAEEGLRKNSLKIAGKYFHEIYMARLSLHTEEAKSFSEGGFK